MSKMLHHARIWLRSVPPRMRVLLVLCLALVLTVTARIVVNRWMDYSASLDQAIEMKTLEYQTLVRNLIGGEVYEELHADLSALREELIASRMVKALTPPLSEAMFQHIVNDWAEKSGVSILSMRVLPRLDKEDFSQMRMAIATRAEIGAIQTFMGLVRQGPRFIFFDEVEIKQISPQERRFYYFNAQLAAWTVL